jgi:Trypsin
VIAPAAMAAVTAIIGGSTADQPAVVGLVAGDSIVCTGVLIDPRVVLTAGHCAALTPRAVVVGAALDDGAEITVLASVPHPDFAYVGLASDLGVLILDPAPVAVTVLPRATAPLSVNASVELVGFGQTGDGGGAGHKREGAARVASLDASRMHLVPGPAIGCRGDSGGPVLVAVDGGWAIAGIVSSGDAACTRTTATRIDAYAGFIDEVLARAYRLVAPGEGCWSELQCVAACVHLEPGEDIGFCACDSSATVCLPDVVPGQPGARCSSKLDCSDLACLTLQGEPEARCYPPCSGDGGACRAGGGACVPAESARPTAACVASPPGCASSSGSLADVPIVLAALVLARRRLCAKRGAMLKAHDDREAQRG